MRTFIALQTAFAQQSQNLANFREQITTHEDQLAKREKVLIQKGNFQTRAGNTIGSLQRLEADLNYRDEVQKYREENWVKNQNDYLKAREHDLLEREENPKQHEADVAKRQLKVNSNVEKGQVVSSLPASLLYPAAIVGSLDIPQGLSFKDAFGKLNNNKPNGGMFREKNSRFKVLTDAMSNGISFNETRMLIDVFHVLKSTANRRTENL